jgi:O-antigen ligase
LETDDNIKVSISPLLKDQKLLNFSFLIAISVLASEIFRQLVPSYGRMPDNSVLFILLTFSASLIVLRNTNSKQEHHKKATVLVSLLLIGQFSKITGHIDFNPNNFYITFISDFGIECLGIISFIIGAFHGKNISFREFAKPLAITAFILILLAPLTTIFTDHLVPPLGNPNYSGAFIAITLPLVGYLSITEKEATWRLFFRIQIVLSVAVLIFILKHRAGVVAAIFGMLPVILGNQKTPIKKYFLLISAVTLTISPLIYIKNHSIEDLLTSSSITSRLTQYEISYVAWTKSPIWGHGSGSTGEVGDLYSTQIPGLQSRLVDTGFFSHPHNDFLEEIIEGGSISALSRLAFLLILFSALFIEIKNHSQPQKNYAMSLLGASISGVTVGLFSIATQTPAIHVVLFFIFGYSVSSLNQKQVGEKQDSSGIIKVATLALLSATTISSAINLKNDLDSKNIFDNLPNHSEQSLEIAQKSNSYFGTVNGIGKFILANKDLDRVILITDNLYTRTKVPFYRLMTLNAELKNTTIQNNIRAETLAYCLRNYPERGITLAASIIYSSYNNDDKGILFSIKKQLGKSIIKRGLASAKSNYKTSVSLTNERSRLVFSMDSASLLLNRKQFELIKEALSDRQPTEEKGRTLALYLHQNIAVTSSEHRDYDKKASVLADLALFIGLARSRIPLRINVGLIGLADHEITKEAQNQIQ